ncbi:MAG: IS5 family transposase [Saprospiraceae bacterium]|nr:IS5 family transposase [Saprospiraceae bacterium]
MKGKLPDQKQTSLFEPNLHQIVNPAHELVLLAEKIEWEYFDREFSSHYSHTGKPSVPVRVMVSLLLLKHMYDLGDETVMVAWVQNPYFQYFSGMNTFQWKAPCDPSDLVHFRKRIGSEGVEKIFQYSVKMHGDEARQDQIMVDTTVQETNITFPTDTKLQVKIIRSCVKIADKSGVKLRQRYPRKVKELLLHLRFSRHPRRRRKANSAKRHIKTIAGRLVRELNRKLSEDKKLKYASLLRLFEQQLAQKKKDTGKIYSFHAPHSYCIAKGKEHKPYEFGTKVSIGSTLHTGIIVSAFCLNENDYDGHTLPTVLEQTQRLLDHQAKEIIVDRGYRGVQTIGDTKILTPNSGVKIQSEYQRRKLRKLFRRRAAIEPLIGHLKSDHRMQRSFYKGFKGDQINVLLASAAWNMKKFMKKLSKAFSFHFFRTMWQFLVQLTRQSQAFGTLSGHGNPAFLLDTCR